MHLVLDRHGGFVTVKLNGKPQRTVRIDGDRLYTLVTHGRAHRTACSSCSFTPGLAAYAFTFG